MREIRSVEAIASHRNGVGGAPFYPVVFRDSEGRRMVALVFPDGDATVGLLDVDLLAAGDIAFGSNSWRYEIYAGELRALLAAWEDEGRPEPTQEWADRVLGDAGFFGN